MVFKYTQDWDELRKMGNTKFVSSMYIWIFVVPLIAKTFQYIEQDILNFVIFEQSIQFNTNLPFSWTMFYFSALFLVIGNLIFTIKCPKIIKDHPSYQSYLNEGKQLKQLAQYSEDIKFEWSKLAQEVDNKVSKIQIDKMEGNGGARENYPNISTEDPVHYFWPIHEQAKIMYGVHRTLCFYSFIIGFALFGLVIVQNSIVVTSFLFK